MCQKTILPQMMYYTNNNSAGIEPIFTSTVDAYSLEDSRLNTATSDTPLAMKYNQELAQAMDYRKNEGTVESIANSSQFPKITPRVCIKARMNSSSHAYLNENHLETKIILLPSQAHHSAPNYWERPTPHYLNARLAPSYYSGLSSVPYAPLACRTCELCNCHRAEYRGITMSPFCVCEDWGDYRGGGEWSSIEGTAVTTAPDHFVANHMNEGFL
ncbi:hypothetical protein K3495_g11843 [Podosphaera aphanis]|nr:hypothetical protein K3495_g11843 [Podosphaera aphanis]